MSETKNALVEALFKVGAHFGYARSRRHATMKHLVFGTKNKTDILDLTKTSELLTAALAFVETLGTQGKMLLFVSGKPEMQTLVREAAASLAMPFVAGRWLGGTLSNYAEIKKRMNRMKELTEERESGVSARKYTKKERLMIDREIGRLEENFTGLVSMDRLPDVLIVVDTKREENAVLEAKKLGIPVIGIMNSDCDLSVVTYPVVGNDASQESVRYYLAEIARAYEAGRSKAS